MDGSLQPSERVAIARLHALLELLPTALDHRLAGWGITAFEYSVLDSLHEADAHRLRLSALASRTNATLPRLSRVLNALERKGLVQRMPCEADGRATNAVLTVAGASTLEAARRAYAEAVRSLVLDGLGDAGAEKLAEVTLAILRRLDPACRLAVTSASGEEGLVCAADPVPATGNSQQVVG